MATSLWRHPFRSLANWFSETILRQPTLYRAEPAEELPDIPDPRTVYLIGEGGYLWYAALRCPCSCGNLLQMNLVTTSRPCWKATVHENGTVSLHPSVWRQKDCRSHFWLRNGRVVWCTGPDRSSPSPNR